MGEGGGVLHVCMRVVCDNLSVDQNSHGEGKRKVDRSSTKAVVMTMVTVIVLHMDRGYMSSVCESVFSLGLGLRTYILKGIAVSILAYLTRGL